MPGLNTVVSTPGRGAASGPLPAVAAPRRSAAGCTPPGNATVSTASPIDRCTEARPGVVAHAARSVGHRDDGDPSPACAGRRPAGPTEPQRRTAPGRSRSPRRSAGPWQRPSAGKHQRGAVPDHGNGCCASNSATRFQAGASRPPSPDPDATGPRGRMPGFRPAGKSLVTTRVRLTPLQFRTPGAGELGHELVGEQLHTTPSRALYARSTRPCVRSRHACPCRTGTRCHRAPTA